MKIPVLVPRRDDHGWRDDVWRWVKQNYWSELPGYAVIEGYHTDGPFNRSKAINTAAELAGDWTVAIIADSDTIVPPSQLEAGVSQSLRDQTVTACFENVLEMSRHFTTQVMQREQPYQNIFKLPPDQIKETRSSTSDPTTTQSSLIAVTRELWDKVGGFDERFVGWGAEDNAFWKACSIVSGKSGRWVPGNAYHLWHPSSRPNVFDVNYKNNVATYQLQC